MTLTDWVKLQGGYRKTGKLMGVAESCVNAWLRGRSLPRPDLMQRIVKLSKGKVTYDEMINATRGKRMRFYALARKKKMAAKKKKTAKKIAH